MVLLSSWVGSCQVTMNSCSLFPHRLLSSANFIHALLALMFRSREGIRLGGLLSETWTWEKKEDSLHLSIAHIKNRWTWRQKQGRNWTRSSLLPSNEVLDVQFIKADLCSFIPNPLSQVCTSRQLPAQPQTLLSLSTVNLAFWKE